MTRKQPTAFDTFKGLAQLARKSRDEQDIRHAMNFGIEHNINAAKIRKFL